MPSSYTQNLNLEQPGTGEQAGTWGTTMNNNLAAIDTGIDGCINIPLPTAQTTPSAPYILSTLQGQNTQELPAGLHKIVTFSATQSGTGYVQIDPATAQRLYFARNRSTDLHGAAAGHPLIFQQVQTGQSPGITFTLEAGYDAVLFADGGNTPGNVAAVIENPQFNNVLVKGNLTVTGAQAQTSIALDTTDVTDTTKIRRILYTTSGGNRWEIQATTGPSETDPNNPASDLKILAYDTSGNISANGSVLYINRASGNVVIGPGANIPSTTLQYPLGNARLTVFPSSQAGASDQPSMNVVGVVGQQSTVFLVQTFNPAAPVNTNPYTNLVTVDSAGNLRIAGTVEVQRSGIMYGGIDGDFTLGGVTLNFRGGILTGHA